MSEKTTTKTADHSLTHYFVFLIFGITILLNEPLSILERGIGVFLVTFYGVRILWEVPAPL